MSLGLPNHLVPSRVCGAIARACHSVAWLSILVAALMLCVTELDNPSLILWPSLLSLVPMAVSLAFLSRERTLIHSVAFLTIGAASTFWYSSALFAQLGSAASNDSFLVSLPKLALILVGGAAAGPLAAFFWVVAGYLIAEGAVALALLESGVMPAFDFSTFGPALLLSLVLATVSVQHRASRHVQPFIHRAARDEELAGVRYRLEMRAAALLHDTVLSQLAALSAATPGNLSPRMRQSIERDLELLVGEEWLIVPENAGATESGGDWRSSALSDTVERARRDGLTVDVSGDLSLVGGLAPDVAQEVARAVHQCLVNVRVHAGTDRAELVVFGSDSGLTIMVIDGGMGFSEADTGTDRLGLRSSVRGRIAEVGGTVDIWSTVGQGTSVLIQVPKALSATDAAHPHVSPERTEAAAASRATGSLRPARAPQSGSSTTLSSAS